MLQRRSTSFVSRSSRSSTGFSGRDVNGPSEDSVTSRTDELSLDHGVKGPALNGDGVCSVEKGQKLEDNTLASGRSVQTNVDAWGLTSSASCTGPLFSGKTRLRSGSSSGQAGPTDYGSDPGVGSKQSVSLTSQWPLSKACGGSAAENGRGSHEADERSARSTIQEVDREANVASTSFAQLLARLPLPKIKILIGEWCRRQAFNLLPWGWPNGRCPCFACALKRQ